MKRKVKRLFYIYNNKRNKKKLSLIVKLYITINAFSINIKSLDI